MYIAVFASLAVVVGCFVIVALRGRKDRQTKSDVGGVSAPENLKNAYTRRWMFTYHEKDVYAKLCPIAARHKLRVFAKVRLFDLVEPIKNHPKYKTNLYCIQAKHVDFVLTTDNLVARYIVELDDNSHDSPDRQRRDEFVDGVLRACGYKVIHLRDIDDPVMEEFLD